MAVARRKVKIVRAEDIPPDQTWALVNGQDEELPPTIGEADFQVLCEETAKRYGWTVYHETDSRKSPKGLPDLIMLSRPSPEGHVTLAMIELKTNKGKPTAEQELWLMKLSVTDTLVTGWFQPRHWRQFVQLCFDPADLKASLPVADSGYGREQVLQLALRHACQEQLGPGVPVDDLVSDYLRDAEVSLKPSTAVDVTEK